MLFDATTIAILLPTATLIVLVLVSPRRARYLALKRQVTFPITAPIRFLTNYQVQLLLIRTSKLRVGIGLVLACSSIALASVITGLLLQATKYWLLSEPEVFGDPTAAVFRTFGMLLIAGVVPGAFVFSVLRFKQLSALKSEGYKPHWHTFIESCILASVSCCIVPLVLRVLVESGMPGSLVYLTDLFRIGMALSVFPASFAGIAMAFYPVGLRHSEYLKYYDLMEEMNNSNSNLSSTILRTRSSQELDVLLHASVQMQNLEAADQISKILLERAETLEMDS